MRWDYRKHQSDLMGKHFTRKTQLKGALMSFWPLVALLRRMVSEYKTEKTAINMDGTDAGFKYYKYRCLNFNNKNFETWMTSSGLRHFSILTNIPRYNSTTFLAILSIILIYDLPFLLWLPSPAVPSTPLVQVALDPPVEQIQVISVGYIITLSIGSQPSLHCSQFRE